MTRIEIASLRRSLDLSQVEFGQLFGAHFMTVSKWERGVAVPTSYQLGLMLEFQRAVAAKQAEMREQVKNVLVTAGVIGAIFMLLSAAKK